MNQLELRLAFDLEEEIRGICAETFPGCNSDNTIIRLRLLCSSTQCTCMVTLPARSLHCFCKVILHTVGPGQCLALVNMIDP